MLLDQLQAMSAKRIGCYTCSHDVSVMSYKNIVYGNSLRIMLKLFKQYVSNKIVKQIDKALKKKRKDKQWRIYSPCPVRLEKLTSLMCKFIRDVPLPPIVVRYYKPGQFRVVDGRCRLLLSILCGYTHIPIIHG